MIQIFKNIFDIHKPDGHGDEAIGEAMAQLQLQPVFVTAAERIGHADKDLAQSNLRHAQTVVKPHRDFAEWRPNFGIAALSEYPGRVAASALPYEFSALSAEDLEEIFDLYETVSASAPEGHLAARSRGDFRAVLNDAAETVAVGAWQEGKLVAYSMCRQVRTVPYDPAPFLDRIDPARSRVYLGMGTVVHPRHEGRMLMARLMAFRGEALRKLAVDHMLGLVAVDNLASIASILRAGALLVGFSRDETAMNYVGYAGSFRELVNDAATSTLVQCSGMESQQEAFASGSVVRSMRRTADGQRSFDFVPMSDEQWPSWKLRRGSHTS